MTGPIIDQVHATACGDCARYLTTGTWPNEYPDPPPTVPDHTNVTDRPGPGDNRCDYCGLTGQSDWHRTTTHVRAVLVPVAQHPNGPIAFTGRRNGDDQPDRAYAHYRDTTTRPIDLPEPGHRHWGPRSHPSHLARAVLAELLGHDPHPSSRDALADTLTSINANYWYLHATTIATQYKIRRPLTIGELLTVRRAIERASTGPQADLNALFTINILLNPFWTPLPNDIPPSAVTIPARQLHRIRTWAGRSYHNPVLRLHAILDLWAQHGPADYQD